MIALGGDAVIAAARKVIDELLAQCGPLSLSAPGWEVAAPLPWDDKRLRAKAAISSDDGVFWPRCDPQRVQCPLREKLGRWG